MAPITMFRSFCISISTLFLLSLSSTVPAQDEEKMMEMTEHDESPLTSLGTEYHNGIKLLQNRFRIDYLVDEVTMVFFREFGSAPIVLVKPDGSKLFLSDADDESLVWFDSASFDMIKIKSPTPGPWQAVGQIMPNSRVMVVSDLRLNVDPLPEVLFSGEILKLSASLTNGGKTIDNALFRDAVSLNMVFESTNNPDYENFASSTQTVATFTDNGLGMDERPLDGKFTGQFNLNIVSGEWRPVFTVATPLASRQEKSENIILQPNPVKVSTQLEADIEGDQGYHHLMVDVDQALIDRESLIIDGKIRFPNGDEQTFSITEQVNAVRVFEIINSEYGIHRVKMTAFGKTVNGRDFILDVPEYTFLVEEPFLESEVTELEDEGGESASETLAEVPPMEAMPEAEAVEEPETNWLLWVIVGANALLLLVGGLFIFLLLRKPKTKPTKEPTSKASGAEEGKSSLLVKMKGMLKFSKKNKDTSEETTKKAA